MEIKFTEFDLNYLDLSWAWVNDPELKQLILSKTITKKEQIKWFKNIRNVSNYFIWGIEINGTPIGACGLKNLTLEDAEYWGYIGERDYWGKGIGNEIMRYLIDFANEKHLNSIYLYVSQTNTRAIKLYEKHGFTNEEIKETIFKMRLYL